jgi:FkbM family methyltransferase
MSDHDPTYWPVLTRLLDADTVSSIVDVGANRGDMTARFAEAYPRASITAIEPNPEICAPLARRFAGEPRVHCVNVALSESHGEAELHVNRIDATSSLFARVGTGRRYFSSGDALERTVRVPTWTLDELACERGIGHIDLLKLDTQGAELLIFRGARALLAAQAVDVIYSEFFVVPHYEGAALFHEQVSFLAQFGYSVFDIFKGPHGRNGQLRFGDAIMVSARFRSTRLDNVPPED